MIHTPVLLKEVIEYLSLQVGDVVLDATLGLGGHSFEICKEIGKDGTLVGIEQDSELLEATKLKIKDTGCKTIFINGNFRNLDKLLEPLEIKYLDAAVFDLGMNTAQLMCSGRGFSFQKNEPLIMNFKREVGSDDLTALEILNTWSKEDIFEILKDYGEERFARSISANIVKQRKVRKFKTTFDLVDVAERSVPVFYTKRRIHFATKTFQALRIAVNDELNALEEGLNKCWDLLKSDGRVVVISFHSLEDRIVKNFFREKKKEEAGIVLTKKPIRPSGEEILLNPKSRSAKLRACEKI